MSSRTVKLLAIGVVVLFAAVFLMNRNGGDTSVETGLLLPALKESINDIESVSVTGAHGTVTISNEDGRWVVPEKHDYPADTAKLRSLLLALADANRVERKTANPALYEHLGVGDPADEEGGGVLVEATGTGAAEPMAVILGDPAQGDYRYARLPAEEASWLIDRNPEVPEAAPDWLLQEIVDIPAAAIRSAEIRHADGETVRIQKEAADETNYRVLDLPEGRELSYPSVANGIAGVLGNLQLEDVQPADAGADPSATVSLTTFDGLVIDLDVWREPADEQGEDGAAPATWITLAASASESAQGDGVAPPADPAGPEGAEATAPEAADTRAGAADPEAGDADAGPAAGNPDAEPAAGGGEETLGDDVTAVAEEDAPDPRERAADINERVSGWRYLLPDYKARQLTRRWEDLLKAEDE